MSEKQRKMFAGVVYGPKDIRYEQIEMPCPGEGEVLVKVKYTGICGSDVPRVNANACHFYPMVLGHEFSGEIVEVGKNVTRVKKGQRVAGVPLVPCLECEDCKKGNYSLCKNYSFIGSRQFGSFAEYVVIPELNAVPFAENITYEQAAFFEPSTVALHGLSCADYRGGKTVVILGAGTIGLLLLQCVKIMGAAKVAVVNRSREKLKLAEKLGADAIVSTLDEDYEKKLMEVTNGRGYDYVFESAGSTEMIKEAFRLAANKAHICMVGTPKDELVFSVSEWEQMNRKEFILTGSWMSYSADFPGEEWKLTARYLETGQLKILPEMVDQIIPLSKIEDGFKLYREGTVKGKILINSEQ